MLTVKIYLKVTLPSFYSLFSSQKQLVPVLILCYISDVCFKSEPDSRHEFWAGYTTAALEEVKLGVAPGASGRRSLWLGRRLEPVQHFGWTRKSPGWVIVLWNISRPWLKCKSDSSPLLIPKNPITEPPVICHVLPAAAQRFYVPVETCTFGIFSLVISGKWCWMNSGGTASCFVLNDWIPPTRPNNPLMKRLNPLELVFHLALDQTAQTYKYQSPK